MTATALATSSNCAGSSARSANLNAVATLAQQQTVSQA
jgi:hypothetical protein